MNIVKSDDYEEVAIDYQCLEIDRLNQTLKRHGVLDSGLRRAICNEYFFRHGSFLDTGWFKSGTKVFRPEMGFMEEELDTRINADRTMDLYLTSGFCFHEYIAGNISWYFMEHNEDAGEIEAGSM